VLLRSEIRGRASGSRLGPAARASHSRGQTAARRLLVGTEGPGRLPALLLLAPDLGPSVAGPYPVLSVGEGGRSQDRRHEASQDCAGAVSGGGAAVVDRVVRFPGGPMRAPCLALEPPADRPDHLAACPGNPAPGGVARGRDQAGAMPPAAVPSERSRRASGTPPPLRSRRLGSCSWSSR